MFNQEKNHFESNMDSTKLNSLDVDNCLFTPELLTALLKCSSNYSKSQKQVVKNKEGIYFIAFRILNKEKRILAYNYIYYNNLFYLTLIVYFLLRNYFIINDNHEWGKYLVILDNKFLDYYNVDKYIDICNTKEKVRH